MSVKATRAMDALFGVVPTAESLRRYEYKSPNLSLAERLFLDRFWSWLPGAVYPSWLAPNAITVGGLLALVGMTANLLRWSPGLRGEAPRWAYGVCGACVWLYQTLDGSDGKQARATRSGSALGEVMDHGVDALATVLITATSMDMAAFGWRSPLTWLPVLTSCAGFYLSNMVLIHKGRQDFLDVDIQEMLLGIQLAFGLAACRGVAFFRNPLALPLGLGLSPRALFVVAGAGGSAANCVAYVRSALETAHRAALRPQFLLLAAYVAAAAANVAAFAAAPPGADAAAHVGPFVVACTAAMGDSSRRLLHQRVGVAPGNWLTPNAVLLAALPLAPTRARWPVAGLAAALFLAGAARSARAMADALGVGIFTIRKQRQHPRGGEQQPTPPPPRAKTA